MEETAADETGHQWAYDVTTNKGTYPETVPDGAHMGNSPSFTVVKRNEPVPDGYYLAPMWIVRHYWEQIKGMVQQEIGDWAVVAFDGGKIDGAGHA